MLRFAILAFILATSAVPAHAGPFDAIFRPPRPVGSSPDTVLPAQDDGGTLASLVARIQRLEGQNRQLTGQVQELQNTLRRTLDTFQRYRDDTEYRLQTIEGGGKPPTQPKRSAAPAEPGPDRTNLASKPPSAPPPATLGTLPSNSGADEMMDGGGGNPDAAAAADGTQDFAPDPNSPLQLPDGAAPQQPPPARRQTSALTPPGLPGIAVRPAEPAPQEDNAQVAALPDTPEGEYTADYRLIEGRNYEAAEIAFRKFLKDHPTDKRAPDAVHWIGESLFQRQQYRDAAEQFLQVTTKYGSSRRAPSSMLRLGMSLAALGEKEAACATFQEVGHKYPSASGSVKSGIERETQKNGC
jgi:tol-pal system protein YbgF